MPNEATAAAPQSAVDVDGWYQYKHLLARVRVLLAWIICDIFAGPKMDHRSLIVTCNFCHPLSYENTSTSNTSSQYIKPEAKVNVYMFGRVIAWLELNFASWDPFTNMV